MIILKPIATQQIIKFIKRPFGANPSNANVDFNLVDEITGEKMTYSGLGQGTNTGDFTKISVDIAGLKEGRFYSLTIMDQKSNGDKYTVYKDRVFVTAQEIDQVEDKTYDINKDVYTEQETSDNDYIVI